MAAESSIKALEDLTDEGLFERIATAVLRESHPLCAGLTHPGTNADGMTVKAPIDNITFVPGANPPHFVCVQHTITKAESLGRKWLYEPPAPAESMNPGAAAKGKSTEHRSPKLPPGDLVKTAEIVTKERARTPDMLATLILTTNKEPGEQLVRDATAAGNARGITVEIWSRSRIAHFLDNTSVGHWIRRQLGIEAELLSRALLDQISRLSLERSRPVDDPRAWVPRALDNTIARQRRQATFLVGESGQGKSVASYRALQAYVANGGVGLMLPAEVLEQASTVEGAIAEALRRLHPKLAAGQTAFEHCTPERPLFVLVEDINRSGHAPRLLEKLVAWTSGNESRHSLRLICPVWPRVLLSVSESTRKTAESMLLFSERMTSEECRAAVMVRARQAGRAMSEISADQLATRLGSDPLLIALHDYAAESDPHDVIGGFIERALARGQTEGTALAHDLRAALMLLSEEMLRRRQLDPSWSELDCWGLGRNVPQCIAQIARAEELVRVGGSKASPRVEFRHDRVRDWLLVECAVELEEARQLTDDLLAEPFYAEIVGRLLMRRGFPPELVERIKNLNPLALFYALRSIGNDSASRMIIRSAIERWLDDPATSTRAKRHLRWEALAVLQVVDGQDIPALVKRFPDPGLTGDLAALHNGDVEAGLRVCAIIEFGTGATFRDRQIEHAKLHFRSQFISTVADWLARVRDAEDGSATGRRGLIELAGHLGDSALVPALERCWSADPAPERLYQEYLFAFARCCVDDDVAARNIAPICDAWAALPSHADAEHRPSPRDDFGAHDLHWAFKRSPPTTAALRYFVLRAKQPDLGWQITYMVNEVDHPIAVQQAVDYAAERIRQSPTGSTLVAVQFAEGWRMSKTVDRSYMSPESRKPLRDRWTDTGNDAAERKAAFRFWVASEGADDLAVLRRFERDALLGDAILSVRLSMGDVDAIPELVEKLRQGESARRSWWHLARHVWSSELDAELEDTLSCRRRGATQNWNESSDLDYVLTDLLARFPIHQSAQILLRHWDHLRYSRRFVQLAFYVATPDLVALATACVKECPHPSSLLAHIATAYGVKHLGHPGVTREVQLLVLEPFVELLSDGDRSQLALACNEAGWFATRRRLFDKYITNTFYAWKLNEASRTFDGMLAGRRRRWIRHEIERAMRTGVSWTEMFGALTNWLRSQVSIDALKMVIEAVIAFGTREDVALLQLVGEANAELQASLIADASYAVRRRSLR